MRMNPPFDAGLLSRVEDAGLNASAPPQQRLVDGWLVRFSPGKAKRARCVNAVAPGRLPLAQKLALCRSVYAEAGLRMLLRITPFSEPARLDAALDAIGMQRIDDTRVMVLADLSVLPGDTPSQQGDLAFEHVGPEAFARWLGAMRGSTLAQQQAHAQRLIQAPVSFEAQVLRRDGELLACGQIAMEADLAGLYDVFTVPTARGQGLAQTLCLQLLRHARARGARAAYLQVEADNAAARRVYQRLGFRDGYAYHYRADETAAP